MKFTVLIAALDNRAAIPAWGRQQSHWSGSLGLIWKDLLVWTNHRALMGSCYLAVGTQSCYPTFLAFSNKETPISLVREQCWPLALPDVIMEVFKSEPKVSKRKNGKNIRIKNSRQENPLPPIKVCPLINCLIYHQRVAAPPPQSSTTPPHPRAVWYCPQHRHCLERSCLIDLSVGQ